MRYILNESDLGVQNVTDELRKKLLEDLGFQIEEQQTETLEEAKTEEPIVEGEEDSLEYTCLFENDGDVYAILEDVYEFEGELFVEAVMLEDEVATLKEGHGDDFADGVTFGESEFVLEGAFEHDDFQNVCFIKLQEMDSTDRPHANDGTTNPKSSTQVKKAVKKSGGALAGAESDEATRKKLAAQSSERQNTRTPGNQI